MHRHDLTAMLADILTPLALHYPQAGYSPAHLATLAEDWCEDLAGYDMDTILVAAKKARSTERYFPNVAVMLDYCALVDNHLPPILALETEFEQPPFGPEQRRRENIRMAMVRAGLKDKRARDFLRLETWPEKESFAREWLGENNAVFG